MLRKNAARVGNRCCGFSFLISRIEDTFADEKSRSFKNNLPEIKSELAKVETIGSIKKNKSSLGREQSVVSFWCGKRVKVYTQ
jgi:hypothetical protein